MWVSLGAYWIWNNRRCLAKRCCAWNYKRCKKLRFGGMCNVGVYRKQRVSGLYRMSEM